MDSQVLTSASSSSMLDWLCRNSRLTSVFEWVDREQECGESFSLSHFTTISRSVGPAKKHCCWEMFAHLWSRRRIIGNEKNCREFVTTMTSPVRTSFDGSASGCVRFLFIYYSKINIFAADPNCHNWVLKREKTIVCPGDLEFVGFDRNCDHLITVAAKPPAVR